MAIIMIVLGTRAELIKMAPVMRELQRRKMPYFFLHAGQHDIRDMIKQLNVKAPDLILEIPEVKRGRFEISTLKALLWNLGNFWRIRQAIKRLKPKLVLVHGDTMTTAAASLAAKSIGVNPPLLAHVEAGLRSGDVFEPFPEEISRRIADFCSDICFAPTERAAGNLRRHWYFGKKVYVTGNTNIDSLKLNLPVALKRSKIKLPPKPYAVAEMHRQENIKSRKRSTSFVEVLLNVPCPIIFTLFENTRRQLEKFGLLQKLRNAKHVRLHETLPYHDFLKLFANTACIITDAGGEIEEATVLRIPCIAFRKASERQEAEEAGVAVRVGSNAKLALEYINEALTKGAFYKRAKKARNPFGEGTASKQIASIISAVQHLS